MKVRPESSDESQSSRIRRSSADRYPIPWNPQEPPEWHLELERVRANLRDVRKSEGSCRVQSSVFVEPLIHFFAAGQVEIPGQSALHRNQADAVCACFSF